jgi:hypothetical protein
MLSFQITLFQICRFLFISCAAKNTTSDITFVGSAPGGGAGVSKEITYSYYRRSARGV